ncbi:Competence protein ComEC [Entamoeba marina]
MFSKQLLHYLIFCIICFCVVNASENDFKIYMFHVGQADSQLIVFPSGYSILVDLGEERDNLEPTNAKYVGEQIEQILNKKHIDVIVLSHVHLDHMGYYGFNGLWYLIEKMGFTMGKFVDRESGVFDGKNRVDCNNSTFKFKYVGEFEQYSLDWVCYANSIKDVTKFSTKRQIAQLCSTQQISPPDEGAEVEVFIRDSLSVQRFDGSPVAGNYYNQEMKPSENGYSIGLRIQYGDFVYATSGDLDGGYYYSYGSTINNVEGVVKDVVGKVDVMKANHHGSRHSNSWDYLNVLKPAVSLISCGENNVYGHPNPDAVYRLTDTSGDVFATHFCNSELDGLYDNYIEMDDDIIVSVNGINATKFTVSSASGTYEKEYDIDTNKAIRRNCTDYFEKIHAI